MALPKRLSALLVLAALWLGSGGAFAFGWTESALQKDERYRQPKTVSGTRYIRKALQAYERRFLRIRPRNPRNPVLNDYLEEIVERCDEYLRTYGIREGRSQLIAEVKRAALDDLSSIEADQEIRQIKDEANGLELSTDPWVRAEQLDEDLRTIDQYDEEAYERLIQQLGRQVPDLTLLEKVADGQGRFLITLLVPGGGTFGVKSMNDKLVGYSINSTQVIPERNRAIAEIFNQKLGFELVDQTYKATTLRSKEALPKVRAAIKEGLAQLDHRMVEILGKGLSSGLSFWQERQNVGRVKGIKSALEQLEDVQWKFDIQVGVAPLGHEVSYASALEAKMNATKAAIMARGDFGREEERKADGDPRGRVYKLESVVAYCKEGEQLGLSILSKTGNQLTIGGFKVPIFVRSKDEVLMNLDVLRDIRKGKLKKESVSGEEEEQQVERIERYVEHINLFDYFKGFTGEELGSEKVVKLLERVGGLRTALAEAIRQKKAVGLLLKDAPRRIEEALTQDLQGVVNPEQGTASEAVFFNRARLERARLIINLDIKDLGLDGMVGYARVMHQVAGAKELDEGKLNALSRSANDELILFKRRALAKVKEVFVKYLELAKGSEAERERRLFVRFPSLLLGGDEVTLTIPVWMETVLPQMVGEMTQATRTRAAITRALIYSGEQSVRAHREAIAEADPASEVLKEFEALQRKLLDKIGRNGGEQQEKLRLEVSALKLGELYVSVDEEGVSLRRTSDQTLLDADKLRQQIDKLLHDDRFEK